MANVLEGAQRLFTAGEFIRLATEFGHDKTQWRKLEPCHRVLVATALAQVGLHQEAKALAELDCTPRTIPEVRSRAEWVLALESWRRGDMEDAQRHSRAAITFADEAGDLELIAWSQLHLFRLRIEDQPKDQVMATLPDVRKAVIRAGAPQATSYLHICVATLEGQMGRLLEARRHVNAAESLLKLSPNAWLAGASLLNRGNLATLSCEFGEAMDAFNEAIATAKKTGHAHTATAAQGNKGLIELLTGKLDIARHTLSSLITASKVPPFWKLSASENLARVYLALGQLDECDQALERVRAARQDPRVASMYHVRWAAITQARLLIRRGQLDAALDCLHQTRDQACTLGDAPLAAATDIVAAHALAEQAAFAAAARRLLAAHAAGITEIPDLRAQFYYTGALVLRPLRSPLEAHLRSRAMRLWQHQGIISVRLEMDPEARSSPGDEAPAPPAPDPTSDDRAACAVNSIAAFPDLAQRPRLLGTEALSVIETLGCSPGARLVEHRPDAEPAHGKDAVALSLGTERRKALSLVCPAPADPAAAVLLGDVLRACRAALELERLREDERNRAAIWPAESAEEQAGALFLAEEMQTLLATARRVATTSAPVLITGETGTGKEVLARTIHAYSPRAKAAFLPFNCTSTPRDMLDSQLFGHRRGAFTGATDHFQGVIRAANGGTLFLDEVGEVSLDVQPKLLRFLESGEVHPIGEAHPVRADVRLIAATNVNLDAAVAQGRFREDLFYRLNVVPLHIPPLRHRREEIPALALHYLRKFGQEYNKGDLRLAEETMEYLLLYKWPGNVRQLANEMRRLAALAETGAVLMPEHLSHDIAASRRTIPASQRTLDTTEVVVRLDQPVAAAVEHLERAMIQYALAQTGGRMEETAALLGLSRKGLYLKRQRFGIKPPPGSSAVA